MNHTLDAQEARKGPDKIAEFDKSHTEANTNLGSLSLAEVKASSKSSTSMPSDFGNFNLDLSPDRSSDIRTASSTTSSSEGYLWKHISPSDLGPKKPKEGEDCGPVTVYPSEGGGWNVKFKPGPKGCTVTHPSQG